MAELHTVCKVGELPEGDSKVVQAGNRLIAVFNDGGKYCAIDDCCPHMGASLAGGHVENGIVTCPWHAWRFRITDGAWCDNPKLKVDVFQTRVVGDAIEVRVPPARPVELPSRHDD